MSLEECLMKCLERDGFAWSTMILGLIRVGDLSLARVLFEEMPGRNIASWNTMISGSVLVDMYAKCGNVARSLVVFFKLQAKNLFCWNSIIEGLAVHGYGEQALDMFKKMEREKIKPNGVTFISVLGACTHAGQAWQLEEALELIRRMTIKPNSVIWGALLLHGNLKISQVSIEKLMNLEPDNNGYYVLLGNMNAEADRWSEAKKVSEIYMLLSELSGNLEFADYENEHGAI
ncbi:hypothetical protein GIB67_034430 [Kingdonia uniflora]|uniref:Pentatricopeptide repeat-containing protein n=1 Tax=Kingdonia uniflora TaxID=39325 RepID=A0A7J7PBK5_9MAGN|nr:hypothetical protein GIB67_034430 [Kingdonia uniflora]